MAITAVVLQAGLVLAAGANTVCTAATGTTVLVKRTVFANDSGAVVTIGINIVRHGVGGPGSKLVIGSTIAAGATWIPAELAGLVLEGGDSVTALSSTGAVVTVIASGFTL